MNQMDQQFMAQKIRAQYTEKQTTELETLRQMDARVRQPAQVFSYVFGSISALIMGAGMSLVMTDIGAMLGMASTLVPGIAVGLVGMALALVNYPLHKKLLAARKKKYGAEILALSEKIMNQ